MKKRMKKGFTIVELVIVIAVIAVLAAVLIPTFASLINKANESADEQTVRNMNVALISGSATETPDTVDEVIKILEEAGFNVDSATKSGQYYMWYQEKNVIVLYDAETKAVVYPSEYKGIAEGKLLSLTSTVTVIDSSNQMTSGNLANYAKYLLSEDVALQQDVSLTVQTQFYFSLNNKTLDLGGHTLTIQSDAPTMAIIGAGTVKNGTVVINTPNGDVYDSAVYESDVTLNVQKVASSSYHFYGEIRGKGTFSAGHFVIEAGAKVDSMMIEAAEASSSVTIENKGRIALVEISDHSFNNTAKINITNSSVMEYVVNNVTSETADINVTGASYYVAGVERDEIAQLFYAGDGTKDHPYLIRTAEQFANIGKLSSVMKSASRYFALNADIDLSSVTFEKQWVSAYFQGTFDGNGHTIKTNDALDQVFLDATGIAKFVNVNYLIGEKNVLWCPGVTAGAEVTFDRVNIGMKDDTLAISLTANEGVYTSWTGYDYVNNKGYLWYTNEKYYFIDCECSVNIENATDYNAVFIGGGIFYSDVVFENCSYSGTYYGAQIGLVLGNASFYQGTLRVTNFINRGTVAGTAHKPVLAGGSANNGIEGSSSWSGSYTFTGNQSGNLLYIVDNALNVRMDENKQIIIHKGDSNAVTYRLKLTGGTRFIYMNGIFSNAENSSYSFYLDLNVSESDWDENGEYATGLYDGYFVTKEQYREINAAETFSDASKWTKFDELGNQFYLLQYEGNYYYVFDFATEGRNSEGEDGEVIVNVYTYKFVVKGTENVFGPVSVNNAAIMDYNAAGVLNGMKECDLK